MKRYADALGGWLPSVVFVGFMCVTLTSVILGALQWLSIVLWGVSACAFTLLVLGSMHRDMEEYNGR